MLTKYEASKILIKDRLHIMNLFFFKCKYKRDWETG